MWGYYDTEAICAEETAVTVRLPFGCSGVGTVLDPGAEGPELAPGASVDVPLWLAASLANRRQAEVELPIFYGSKMRRKMKAGAGCEDLRVRCPHYYTVAAKLHETMVDGQNADDTFPPFILSVLRSRYKVRSKTGGVSGQRGSLCVLFAYASMVFPEASVYS